MAASPPDSIGGGLTLWVGEADSSPIGNSAVEAKELYWASWGVI